MDHQQYKLVVTVNFVAYPIDRGRMLPSSNLSETYMGVVEVDEKDCKKYIGDFIKNHNDMVKTRG